MRRLELRAAEDRREEKCVHLARSPHLRDSLKGASCDAAMVRTSAYEIAQHAEKMETTWFDRLDSDEH